MNDTRPTASARFDTTPIVVEDLGPGIGDLDAALTDGFSTAGGLGLGLGGARRLVNEFHLESLPGRGTRVTVVRWA